MVVIHCLCFVSPHGGTLSPHRILCATADTNKTTQISPMQQETSRKRAENDQKTSRKLNRNGKNRVYFVRTSAVYKPSGQSCIHIRKEGQKQMQYLFFLHCSLEAVQFIPNMLCFQGLLKQSNIHTIHHLKGFNVFSLSHKTTLKWCTTKDK